MDEQNNSKPTLKEQIQSKVVELITQRLEEGTMTEDRARSIAKLVLETIPDHVSDNELMTILPKLDDEFREMSDIVLPIIVEYEEKIKSAVEQKALALVRARKFKEALDITRKGIEFSKQLA